MAGFKYRMQSILEIKSKLELQAKSYYAAANERLRLEEKKLDSLYDDIGGYERQIKQLCLSKLDLMEIKRCKDSIEIKKIYVKRQIQQVSKAGKNLEMARARLNEVMVERKTHERLRDKEFEEYVRMINEKEMKEIDELVSYSYNKINSR